MSEQQVLPQMEPVADGGGMPPLPATTDPFETLRNTARWCMAASRQDWEDDLIDIKTAASGAPKTILALFAQLESSQAALAQSEAERERLQGAIDWALGASGEFRERGASEGAYWWRTELRSRALLADRAEPAPVVTGGEKGCILQMWINQPSCQ